MSDKTQYHVQRLGALRTERANFDQQWEEASALLLPAYRDSFTGRSTTYATQGLKKTELQFDSTAAFAAYRFASVIESLATPQNSLWHLLKPVDKTLRKNRTVKIFFDELTEVLFNYRYRPVGNFVGNSQQTYLGLGVYGNGVLFVDKPDNQRGLRYRNVHLGETYFVENHAGVIDTVYRAFPLTARQILTWFGDAAPDAIKEAVKNPNQRDVKHEILHVVQPRNDVMPGRLDSKGKPFASIYIYIENQSLLREGGYDTFPYAIARYTQASGETYGRGPAQQVLPAIKVLNEEKRTVLKQGHRAVDPVLLAHDDGQLASFSMVAGKLNAGGVNADGKLLVHALPVGDIVVGEKMMDIEINVIQDAFLVKLFQILIETPQMTATEVLERAREKGMLLAPTAGRLQAEFLGPLIEREIDVLARQGLLPPIPAILAQAAVEYRIEYDSPMSRMQRSEKAAGFMRALADASEYAKMTGDVEPLDHFNFDVATPEILDIRGAPVAWTRSLDEVQARREARQQAQQQQQLLEAAPALASVASTAAKTPTAK